MRLAPVTYGKAAGCVWAQVLLLAGLGCAVTPVRDRHDVADALRERTGHGTPLAAPSGEWSFPEDVDLVDGLSEGEAVAIALWNNPSLRADLATLGIARAELLQAGLLRNPVLSLLFPVGPKQLEAGIGWQVESLWQRPRRVSIAQLNLESVAEGLVQHGLDLVLQVKVAYADLLLEDEYADLAEERALLLSEIARLAEARLRAGDIGELDFDVANGTALEATLQAERAATGVVAARARLLGLLGVAADLTPGLRAAGSLESIRSSTDPPLPDLQPLLDRAWAARPDLRAAELRLAEAGERAGLARAETVSLTAIVDANSEGEEGFEVGPGLELPIPLFDRGQAARARATAGLEHAMHAYADVQNRIAERVRQTRAELVATRQALERYRESIVRIRRDAVDVAEKSHAAGELSYQDVLVVRVRYVDALIQQAGITAELLRARASLEHAIGSDLDRSSADVARSGT